MFFQLNPGYLLQGDKYKIIKPLGQGGFGITYLAEQTLMERKVCIKEFFMKEYCDRDEATSQVSLGTQNNAEMMRKYQEKFLKEARMIARLDHPNIIRIFDVFTENNTAYYVMEYIEGKSLNELVKESGALPETVAIEYVRQIGEGLAYVHDHNINHLDIKPGNILVRESDNRPILIDFGMSKQYDESGDQTSSTPLGISEGYAPLEMYRMGGVSSFSPQTDIYELGATLFRLVTGVVPPSASDVINEGLPEFPSSISSSTKTAIEKAMEYRKKDRPETMTAFLSLLSVAPAKLTNPTKTSQRKKTPKSFEKRAETPPEDDDATVILETTEKQYGSNAERKYLDAANEGDAEAQYKLSMCYEKGKEVKKNSEEALKWLQLAANGGHVTAQLKMGGCCYDGKGVKQDYAEAIKWFQKAAEQGNADALVRLARCYYNGVGVKRDLDQATSLAKKALLIKPNDAGAEQVLDFINQMKIALSAASRRTRKKEEAKEVPKKDKAKVKETPKQFGILSIYSSCNGKDDASFTISVEMGEEKQLMAFFSVSRNGEPVTVFGSSTQFGDNVIVKKPKDSTVGRGTVSFDFSQSQLQSEPSGTITFELNIILSKHMNSTKIMEDDLNYSYQYRIVHVSHLFKHDEWKSLRLIKQIV